MKRGSKYYLLFEYLQRSGKAEVSLSLAEIETILGLVLPASARTQSGWWSNRSSGGLQAAAWLKAGYHASVNLANEQVIFHRPQRVYQVQRQGESVLWTGELIKALRLHTGWSQAQLAEELHLSRQQTVSEWETGLYPPGRRSRYDLQRIAEQTGFSYGPAEEAASEPAGSG